MRTPRFSEQQIAFILKQADDGLSVEEVCRKAGISQQTYYRWRKKYGGLMPSEVKRLKMLEDENSRLKRMVADLSLGKAMPQDVLQKSCSACEGPAVGRLPPRRVPGLDDPVLAGTPIPHARHLHGHWANAGHHLAFRQVTMTDQARPPLLERVLGKRGHERSQLGVDSLLDQLARPRG